MVLHGILQPEQINLTINGQPVTPPAAQYDAQAEALTVATGALAPADALQITVSTGEPSLLSKRDRRADTVRYMLRAFRLDSRAKFEIDYELPRLLNGEIALLRYHLSDTQRSALREVLGERAAGA